MPSSLPDSLSLFGHNLPPVAIGCAPLASMPDTFTYAVPEDVAYATIRTALESPLNWLDTAASYGDGESERRIGHVLREIGGLPTDAFLNTKIGADADGSFDAETVMRRFARSQELLGIERFDLVYLHDPEKRPFEEITAADGPLQALLDLRDSGVIRYLGVAGGPIDEMTRYINTGLFDSAITHNRYTLLDRSATPLLDHCHEKGIPVSNAAPYGSGILARGPSRYPRYAYQKADGPLLDAAHELEAICSRYNVPLAAAALQFSMRDRRIAATIIGMSRPERIQQTIKLATTDIPPGCWQELLAVPIAR